MTVEGEKDDISGVGQTEAAHDAVHDIPADTKAHYLQPEVGHYGVFNGSRFRAEIAPRIADFISNCEQNYRKSNKTRQSPAVVPFSRKAGAPAEYSRPAQGDRIWR